MACLGVPEGEYDELLEHVPLSTRRKLLLSSSDAFIYQVENSNSLGHLSVPACSAEDQVDQHLQEECSPNCKGTASAFKVATKERSLESFVVARGSQRASSCLDVGLPINGKSQGSEADQLTGAEANAGASGPEMNVGVSLPPNPVPSNDSDNIKVEYGENMLLSLSKDDRNSSATIGVLASREDVGLPINGDNQGSEEDQLTGAEANANAFGPEINVGVSLPPNPVPSNDSDNIEVEYGDNMLQSLSKDDTNSSATIGVVASCEDVGLPVNGNGQGSQVDQLKGTEAYAFGLEKINVGVPLPSNDFAIEKVDCVDNMQLSLSKDDPNSSVSNGVIAVNTMDKKLSDFTFDELDHIVLKERKKLLLKRKLVELEKPALEGTSFGLAEDLMEYPTGRIKQELHLIDAEFMTAQNQFNDVPIRNAYGSSSCSASGSSSLECSARRINDIHIRSAYDLQRTSTTGTKVAMSGNIVEESNIIYASERTSTEFKLRDGDESVSASTNHMYNSTLNTSVKVKDEPLDYDNFQNLARSTLDNMVSVKCEEDISDGLDHMLLRDRMKLLTSVEDFQSKSSWNSEFLRKKEPDAFGFRPLVSESDKPIWLNRPRKRKKTATDSVLTALEEDAPELLKVLLDQGVSVDEINLYGEPESDDVLDGSLIEESFSELEAVITKLFSQRSPLLKFSSIQCTKGSKPSYCLACLFSLVEQTRYLQFRGWPVEWGWCRDLQSFIFVFKRHHRIVLERPEYGYATYFFELLDSLPIDWQVTRLVTAMKLTSYGRIALIENKPLSVGEDLTEGEAKVLMEYGWIPNTGLGTMLNYRDRVIHDRKNEKDSSEWRSKIGKLLVDGYNGGTIVSTSFVEKVIKAEEGENTQIKLEF